MTPNLGKARSTTSGATGRNMKSDGKPPAAKRPDSLSAQKDVP
jgi:hypothetical protein